MAKNLFRKTLTLLGMLSVFLIASSAIAQTDVNTNHISNNGSGMVTFHVQNTNAFDIILTEFRSMTSTAGAATTVLYNPVAFTGATWTAGIVGAGQNGWVLVGNGTAGAANVTAPFLTGSSLLTVPAGATYGFAVSCAGLRYMTLTAGVNTFSGGGVNILTGTGIGFGGAVAPNSPTIALRGLIGGISFIPATPCITPPTAGTIVAASNPVCPSVVSNLTLTSGTGGTGQSYQWQSSLNNTTWTNIAGATSSAYPASQVSNTYYRCIVTCSGLSDTTSSFLLTTNSFLNCYCTSNATNALYEDIIQVSLGTLNNLSACGSAGGAGSIASQYSDYTNSTPAVNIPFIQQGNATPMTIAIGQCSATGLSNSTKVFIDYNQNGLFTDAGEEVYVTPTFTSGANTMSFSLIAPTTSAVGQTRMRIVNQNTTIPANITPCGTYTYGETEDYFIFISAPLANDAGITGFVNPNIPTCAFNDTVTVTLRNYGTSPLTSASINWKLNNTVQTPAFWTGSLAPQTSTTVFVGTVAYGAGDNLYAWTSNPNGVVESPTGAFNDSSSLIGLLTGLSGTYTIGGTAPSFPDVATAINAMNFAGICGPTTFDIRAGTYFDQFSLGQVTGMSSTNTVTFRSEDGHRDSVTFDYASTALINNYVINLDNADYFRFEDMTLRNSGATFGVVMNVTGGSDYNIVSNCKLHTQAAATTSTNICVLYSSSGNDEFNRFENNSFVGGSYGAYWNGTSTSSLEKGSEFVNNEFVDNYYQGLRLSYQEAPLAHGNRIHGVSTYTTRYGMYVYYCDKGTVITHNSVESNATSSFYYGMYVGYCDANSISRGLFANNMITTGNTTSTAISYAMYFITNGFLDVYNNTVSVVGGATTSRALYVSGGGANNFKNNSFTNFGGGYSAYVIGTYAINDMDYNNYYTTGTVLNYFDAANTSTFADWQTASGFDAHSLNVDPGFYSDFDLHVCSDSLNNAGTPLALVTDDFDGQPRSAATPDIGADEFAPLGFPGFLGSDALICAGQTVSFTAGAPADDVLWSTNDTTNVLVVTMPGTYTVSVIGTCGISFDTVVVTASALTYSNFLNASVTEFCTGGSALLTSTMPATTYSWTGGSSNDSLVVTTGGTYTLNIVDACGSGTASVVITQNTVPVASFTKTTSFITGIFTNTTTGGGNPTYSWNFGDGTPASTLMSPAHVYATPGTYYVTLTVTNSCGTSTIGDSITVSTIGLEEINGLSNVVVYPNPTSGLFQVNLNTAVEMNVAIQITNVLGESILVKDLGSINGTHNDAIDLSNAAPGVYYVTIVSNNEKVVTNKIVKQ